VINRSNMEISLTNVRHLGEFCVRGNRRLPVPAARSRAVDIRFLTLDRGSEEDNSIYFLF
jgi:hypothetical protein